MASLSLQRGQRLKLSQITSLQAFIVSVNPVSSSLKFDVSCFGLNEAGKLSDERFFVFYNQKSSPDDAIRMLEAQGGDAERFRVDLSRLPPSIRRLMWVISVDGTGEMRQMGPSHLRFLVGGEEIARFAFSGQELGRERALMVLEVYFKDEWRVNAVGQGFAGGLDAVLTHFGGEVAKEPAVPAVVSPPAPPQPIRTIPPARPNDGKSCVRCGKTVSFWEKTTGRFNSITGRCSNCEYAVAQEKQQALLTVGNAFARLCQQPNFDAAAWQNIKQEAINSGVLYPEILETIRTAALWYLDSLIGQSAADGVITPEEDRFWSATLQALALPAEWTSGLWSRWEQEKTLSQIRLGHLPRVQADFHLESDEVCHMIINAQFLRQTKTITEHIPVRLAATNKKFYVLELGGGGRELSYAKFLRVLPSSNAVTFELSVKAGAGTYYVDNPHLVDAIVTTLVRTAKRQLVQEREQKRTIPHAIRTAVWQRDGAKCVQCDATGRNACLEYDHIIPFSLGGASTEGNLRLLCRRCNLDKGARI